MRNKKSLGQNFIYDKNFLKKISDLVISNSDNTIIEVGPGPGTLTEYLFKKDYEKIILIEKDQRLIKNLNQKFSSKKLTILNEDALNFDYGPIFSTFGYNDVEGIRLRTGGRTYFNYNDPWRLEGYTAYGFKDQKFKYGIQGKAILENKNRNENQPYQVT